MAEITIRTGAGEITLSAHGLDMSNVGFDDPEPEPESADDLNSDDWTEGDRWTEFAGTETLTQNLDADRWLDAYCAALSGGHDSDDAVDAAYRALGELQEIESIDDE